MSFSETGRYDSNHISQGESFFDSPKGKVEAFFTSVPSGVLVSAPPISIGNDEVSVREAYRFAGRVWSAVTKLSGSAERLIEGYLQGSLRRLRANQDARGERSG